MAPPILIKNSFAGEGSRHSNAARVDQTPRVTHLEIESPYHRVVSDIPEATSTGSIEGAISTQRQRRKFLGRRRSENEQVAESGATPHAIAKRWPPRVGNSLPLATLAAEYRPERHQIYLDLLERALRHPDTRSVALTGSYGSGKSSVLRALGGRWWDRRVITELSLSTLDPEFAPDVQTQNPAEKEMSNRIQKELVKQLLYRLPARKTPRSRFPRASTPSWVTGPLVGLAGVALSGIIWTVVTLAGWQATVAERLEGVGWNIGWFWVGAAAALAVLTLVAWRALSGRYAVRAGLNAGTLTVSLEPSSSSYFDQYLDEIMYFFQVSKTEVVLIEDVDRFGDAIVFDTLRALNTLVNSSGQVGRRVVFVYAIRDSVLGQIGAKRRGKGSRRPDESALQIDRANRAKYFDVIIPMVPFVTTDNARDLMMQVMKPHVAEGPDGEGVSPALIRLAARHVADMRTLWSVRNEFEVHLDRLVTSAPHAMPGINKDIILSLVLLRATSPEAYEGIRLAASPLDTLTRRWLALTDANIEIQTKNLTSLQTQLENGESMESRAKRAGQALDAMRGELLSMATRVAATEVEFGAPLNDADLTSAAGWQEIANGTALPLTLYSAGRRTSEQTSLSPQILSRLVGMKISPTEWQATDLEDLAAKISAAERDISFLRHHTWEQLYARPEFVVTATAGELKQEKEDSTGEVLNFKGLVAVHAPTPLARDLIAHGFLPRHFARYASTFYGAVVGLDAAEYIARAIEPGIPAFDFELDGLAIAQILTEQDASQDDADLFDDVSVYNLDIVRYLINKRPGAAKRVAAHVAKRWGELEQKFVGRFFQRESPEMAGRLAALMAPEWGEGLLYATVVAKLAPDRRVHIVNEVLGALRDGEQAELRPEVGRYLAEHHSELPIVLNPSDEARATIVMTLIATSGASITDLSILQPVALLAASNLSVYPVSEVNLAALGGGDKIALDSLRSEPQSRPIYDHMLKNLTDYLDAIKRLIPPGTVLKEPKHFAVVLNDVAAIAEGVLDEFVENTADSCRISDLTTVVPAGWPALAKNDRMDATFENVQLYVGEHEIDSALGRFFSENPKIITPATTPAAERLTLAVDLLAARAAVPKPASRVALAKSVEPGLIPIGQIAPEDADLVGPLLKARLLADDPSTFGPGLLTRSEDLEAAIAASVGFGAFADATTMPPRHLASVLKNKNIQKSVKAALILKLVSLLAGATAVEATAIAEALADRTEILDLARIEALIGAGATNIALVRLIVVQGTNLSVAELRAALSTMGGDYKRLSNGGSGKVRFAIDQAHRDLLERLSGLTHTGAKEGFTIRHGTKLEASLKQA